MRERLERDLLHLHLPLGGDRGDVALSDVYAYSGCVAARWLCVL